MKNRGKTDIIILILTGLLLGSCGTKSQQTANESISNSATAKEVLQDLWKRLDEKAAWFKQGAGEVRSVDSVPADFLEFYGRFIADSVYQAEHIQFPVLAVVAECDSTILLTARNWKNYTWDFRKDFDNPNEENLIYLTGDRFYFESTRKEVGLLFQIGFEKQNGTWLLTLYIVNTC